MSPVLASDALGTELSDLGRLPRPDPLLPSSPTVGDLKLAFPFLFKPNRVLALHRKGKTVDHGHPCECAHGRWLVRLRLGEELADLPPCVAVIGRDGWLGLWCYCPGVGLSPLRLVSHRSDIEIVGNTLCFQPLRPENPATIPQELVRATGQTDDEGRHQLTLDTPEGSYRITLDFGTVERIPDDAIPCDLSRSPPRETKTATRQIGGWDLGDSFHWDETERTVYRRGGRRREPVPISPELDGVRMHAAASRKDILVIGGQSDRLSIRRPDSAPPQATLVGKPIRGHVYSIAIAANGGSAPIVLVGCDDHVLYILAPDGRQLQKVRVGGLVDGILPLPGGAGRLDLVLLVRYKGLLCGRLFLDRLRLRDAPEPDRSRFLDQARGMLGPNPLGTLRRWLESNEPIERMIAIRLIVSDPRPKHIELFGPAGALLQNLDPYSTNFLAHCLRRALHHLMMPGRFLEDQAEQARLHLDLLLNMACGSYHSRMAVRQLEGWLLRLLKDCKAEDIHEKLEVLERTLPDAKKHYARTVADVCRPSLGDGERAISLLASLQLRLSFDRLFTEHVLVPDQGQGQIRAVTMLRDREGLTRQVYAPRGIRELQSFRLDDLVAPGKEAEDWSPGLERPGDARAHSVRQLVPLGESQLMVVAADGIGWVAESDSAVHWLDATPQRLWCAAFHNTADSGLIASAGDWDPLSMEDGSLISFYRWDGKRLTTTNDGLPPRPRWQQRFQVRALVWDDEGGLWAVTAEQGALVHWDRKAVENRCPPTLIARVGVAQYALAVFSDLVVTGGADGAVRAFRRSGGLAWLYPTPGAIRGLVALDADIRVKGKRPCLALATEGEHVVLLDRHGQQLAMLFLPHAHPFSLAAGTLLHDGQLHLMVGTLEGDVRVLEVVADGWKELYAQASGAQTDAAMCVEGQLDRYAADRRLLESWCTAELARHEPLQTVVCRGIWDRCLSVIGTGKRWKTLGIWGGGEASVSSVKRGPAQGRRCEAGTRGG